MLLLIVGCLFIAGLVADIVGRKTGIPRVTLLLIFGVVAGPAGADIFPPISEELFQLICNLALAFVSFLLGENFDRDILRSLGKSILILSGVIAVTTWLLVSVVCVAFGIPIIVSLLLGAIATATDPIATRDVVKHHVNQGEFTKQLIGVVSIDDAWGIIIFSIVIAAIRLLDGGALIDPLLRCLWEIGGAVVLGIILGIPMVFLTGRIEPGEPTLVEALGFILICAGAALYLQISMLLAAMVMGAITVNFARHHNRPFQAIEGIEWPLLVGFFFLTGATLSIENFAVVISFVLIYCFARVLARIIGGELGGRAIKASKTVYHWYGPALLPQAGVALGMALVAHNTYPLTADLVLPIIVIATIIFEILGPLATKTALDRTAKT